MLRSQGQALGHEATMSQGGKALLEGIALVRRAALLSFGLRFWVAGGTALFAVAMPTKLSALSGCRLGRLSVYQLNKSHVNQL